MVGRIVGRMYAPTLAQLPTLLALRAALWWRRLDLAAKRAVAASVAVVAGLATAAWLVAGHIEETIIHRAGAATALYTDSFVAAHAQELATKSTLSEEHREALEQLLSPVSMGRPVIGFRIWKDDRIVFGSDHQLIGKSFPPSTGRRRALEGGVSAEIDHLDGDDDTQLRALNVPILEVYAPVRLKGGGRIIAIAETYEIATNLKQEIHAAQLVSWLAFALAALVSVSFIMGLQGRGAREILRLRAENEQVRTRVGEAHQRVSDMNEQHMRSVGTELYSGPVQLVSLALLKFDSLREMLARKDGASPSQAQDLAAIHKSLNEALSGIRDLSASLVPSRIEALTLGETIAMAVRKHERNAGTQITCAIRELPTDVTFSVRACLYRFVRESLAALSGKVRPGVQHVRAQMRDGRIEVEVVHVGSTLGPLQKLGLSSTRDRVESLGGVFLVRGDDAATSITAQFADRTGEADRG